jgi:hypothetical protein
MSFVPRSVRGTDEEAGWNALRPGAPDGVRQPLLEWIADWFNVTIQLRYVSGSTFRLLHECASDLRFHLSSDPFYVWAQFEIVMTEQPDQIIDVLDWCLHRSSAKQAGRAERLLERVHSAYKVSPRGDAFEIVDRIGPTVTAAVQSAAPPHSVAAHHLEAAWSHVYGRTNNPDAGYAESVKAVEAVVLPVVIPKDSRGTLGKAIDSMSSAPGKWKSTLGADGVTAAIAMLDALWRQQRRHASAKSSVPISSTQDEAEAALHLAATLVHWFDSGVVSK